MKSIKLKLTSLMGLFCLFVCGATTSLFAGKVFAEDTSYAFENTKIIGAQVRLDGTNALRYVIEMDDSDYQAYIASQSEEKNESEAFVEQYQYQLGVLVFPTELLGSDELTTETTNVANKLFALDYEPKKIQNDEGIVEKYNFNVALNLSSAEAQYAKDITARPYIQVTDRNKTENNVTITYLDSYNANSSKLASKFYAGDQENQTKYLDYVLRAFNEVSGEECATLADLQAKVDFELALNDINTVLVGETVEGYSNTLNVNPNYANILDIDIAVDDEFSSIDEKNVITGAKLGTSTVTASILGGEVSQSLNYDVFDSTVYKAGDLLKYNSGVLERDEDGKIQRASSQTVKTVAGNQFGVFNNGNCRNKLYLESSNQFTLSEDFLDSYEGRDGSCFSATTTKNTDLYWNVALPYTQAQIKMLLDAGYVNVNVPMYVGVSEEDLTHYAFNYGEKKYFTLTTPNTLADQTADKYTTNDGSFYDHVNQGKIYVNEWTDIQVSLQYIYENYNKLGLTAGSNTLDESRWNMFGIALGMYQDTSYSYVSTWGDSAAEMSRTFTIGDITLTKEKTDVDEGVLNTSNADKIRTTFFAGDGNNDRRMTTLYTTSGTVNGRTAAGGNFIALTNSLYKGGYHTNVALLHSQISSLHYSPRTDYYQQAAKKGETCVYIEFEKLGWTLEYLQGLYSSGKSTLDIDVIYSVDTCSSTTADTVEAWVEPTTSSKTGYHKYATLSTEDWTTVSISLEYIIKNYTNYNATMEYTAVGNKFAVVVFKTTSNSICTFYLDNIHFE